LSAWRCLIRSQWGRGGQGSALTARPRPIHPDHHNLWRVDPVVMLSSVAPSVQEEVLIQERFDLLEVLKKEFEALMTKSAKAAP